MRDNYAESVLNSIVKQLTEARKVKGISHESLAKKAGITRAAVSHIESGRRRPSIIMCIKIARALDLQLASIIKKAEGETSSTTS